jgi:molybdenum cofactor cytidylyltransferase
MELRQALRISGQERIAFVGAGGKTTALFQLARELGSGALVTTTTHFSTAQLDLADQVFSLRPGDRLPDRQGLDLGKVFLFHGPPSGERVGSLTVQQWQALVELAGLAGLPLLVEADGSRQLPVKAPAEHEPALPAPIDLVVVCAGLQALGKPITEDWVHRAERFQTLSGTHPGDLLTPDALGRVLAHPEGGLKNLPAHIRKAVLLNQADDPDRQAQAQRLSEHLLGPYAAVITASLAAGRVLAIHERTAAIVLAAGSSDRMGRPKQLLEWRGKPFIRTVIETALAAGLDPVRVVLGAHHAEVRAVIQDLQVEIIHNTDWSQGQSTSVRAGVAHLDVSVGGAVFFLVDQPQIPATLVRKLVEHHATTLAKITAPLVAGERGNPVLFDRATFQDFENLTGDRGARVLFRKYKIDWVPWHDERPLLDVDTHLDYEKLKGADFSPGRNSGK